MSSSFLDKFKFRGVSKYAESLTNISDDTNMTTHDATLNGEYSNGKESPSETECERILKEFQLRYANSDKMLLQDILVKHNWNREAALKQLEAENLSNGVSRKADSDLKDNDDEEGPIGRPVDESVVGHDREGSSSPTFMRVRIGGSGSNKKKFGKSPKNAHKYAAINAAQRDSDPDVGDADDGKHGSKNRGTKKQKKKSIMRKRARFECSDEEDESATKREKVYNSSDSDSEKDYKRSVSAEVLEARRQVVDFLNEAPPLEMEAVPTCSNKRVEKIISLRPYSSYMAAVSAINSTQGLTPEILNEVQSFLASRNIVAKLMSSCEGIAQELKTEVEAIQRLEDLKIKRQPANISEHLKLAPHQLIGINWMALLYEKGLNGILADEMGLGKTIQVITFLGWLLEKGEKGPHLVVVPSSTLDNWHREFTAWCPSLKVVIYSGPQEDRKLLRLDVVNGRLSMNVILATYNTLASSPEDRGFFRKLEFVYAVFDEAHMLKNMNSQRYQNLIQIGSTYKLMLTGTPLQNNLIELMSLLTFTMPHLFSSKTHHMKSLFRGALKTSNANGGEESARSIYERERIKQAKAIMQPFVLRRLKADVLANLPKKYDHAERVEMTETQKQLYRKIVELFKKSPAERRRLEITKASQEQVSKQDGDGEDPNAEGSPLMQLRKAANHPLLLRTHFGDARLRKMAVIVCKQPSHRNSTVDLVVEDMQTMSDFQLHSLCLEFGECLNEFRLPDKVIANSGKFEYLRKLIPAQLKKNNRVLIFSQFTMMLDIIEKFLHIEKYNYLRIDGSTPVTDRQDLIDAFVNDETIPVFLLSTKACGLGINLTAANVVVLHDIDFNPYNDKQAEDRSHRIGQTREVFIYRLISRDTIEEGMYAVAQEKLRLEKRLTAEDAESAANSCGEPERAVVGKLLKQALEVAD